MHIETTVIRDDGDYQIVSTKEELGLLRKRCPITQRTCRPYKTMMRDNPANQ